MNNTPENNEKEGTNDRPADLSANKFVDDQDIHDSDKDMESMKKEESFTIDLPDVADIPGQEHVHVPSLGELADTTISSDDEEGTGLFDDEDDDYAPLEVVMANDTNVGPTEKKDLRIASEDIMTGDNTSLREAALDNRDNEGDQLNEGSSATNISGDDLDTPGADADDEDESIGEEDEENNSYSLGSENNDDIKSDEF